MKKNGLEVQSLQRALDILEVVGNSRQPVPLKEITAQTGLPKSTVYRLLSNLEAREYIRCNADTSYQLGLKLLMMSQRVEQSFELKHLARPYIVELNEYTRESVHLGMLHNNRVLYVDTVESAHTIRLVAKVGATNWVHFTALGKALLVQHSDEAIVKILQEQGMDRKTASTLVTPAAFLEEMERVRREGYAWDEQESEDGCRCVGAPIFNHKGQVVAAISISGPVARVSRDMASSDFVPRLLSVTRELSNSLGAVAG
ncbi:MAG TPA: IclR family transcriptional regulator [Patescibacteria group bacterium]|nr:IclR family transcriptional regulator [Patescibacteria group bacterium]